MLGQRNPMWASCSCELRGLNCDRCKRSPSIRKEECKTRNIHHSIESQSRYARRGEDVWKWPVRTYQGRSRRWSSLKGRSLTFRHERGAVLKVPQWREGLNGGNYPSNSAPDCKHISGDSMTMMSEIKFWNCSQIVARPWWMGGGRGTSYCEPRKFPLTGLMRSSTQTPSRIMRIRSTGQEPWFVPTQTSGCKFPQLWKKLGFRKRS